VAVQLGQRFAATAISVVHSGQGRGSGVTPRWRWYAWLADDGGDDRGDQIRDQRLHQRERGQAHDQADR